MGFKNAWELVSQKSPLLGINHFFFLRKISDSYKGGRNPENKTEQKELGWSPIVF